MTNNRELDLMKRFSKQTNLDLKILVAIARLKMLFVLTGDRAY
jgi:hypothetical protein